MEQTKALVLLNMGAARSKDELEEFLINMFNDKNILTLKSDFWRSKLASYITTSRLDEAWENYEVIGGQSPLHEITQSLINKLQTNMPNTFVTSAMRYTQPNAFQCIEELEKKGITDIILLPLYPQYSTTTTKSSVEDFMYMCEDKFTIKILKPFYKNSDLNNIICDEILKQQNNDETINLIFSAHGLPQKVIDNGDTYQIHIQEHIELIKKQLLSKNAKFESISLAYQSKVGPMKWLEPSLDNALKQFKDKNVLIYPISFMIENSETDFELAIEYKEIAQELGIKEYKVCSCPNDKGSVVDMISNMVL
ncbi:MAG: ferrochelatase [Campylobacteraceae bacterium]|jgi:ferrochelatase|nr:ferrochelatase [Campylobacteraceae bacterium]MBT3883071.1 ferrochelatase [Campylobacteraceae bacterium]MBT4030731.1 ferrochelatase [Campylobacteraceae bacterium]MBT4178580.1 ferrochelatase [Campylobacteraceae bacterium]MBT4572702.1 ferrochelatase [Campylobacteraceae bacterium]